MGKSIDDHIFCRTLYGMEARRGRPRKAPEERLAERIEVRADSSDKRLLEEAAEKSGEKLSDWIRDRLVRAAKRELRRSSTSA